MTRTEFYRSLPQNINHKSSGYGELEIVCDSKNDKGACYRHKDQTSSCSVFGSTWSEVYAKLSKHLISEGYIKE